MRIIDADNLINNINDLPEELKIMILDVINKQPAIDKKELQKHIKEMKSEEQIKKETKIAEKREARKARRKNVFKLRASDVSVTEISTKLGIHKTTVEHDLFSYLCEHSESSNSKCLDCRYARLTDVICDNGKLPYLSTYCVKLSRGVSFDQSCDLFKKRDIPVVHCEECKHNCGFYYRNDTRYIRCDINDRWDSYSTCRMAERRDHEDN